MKIYVCIAKVCEKPHICGTKAFPDPWRMLSRGISDRQKIFWGRSICKITLSKPLVHIKTAPPASNRKGNQKIKKMLSQSYPTFPTLHKELERLFSEISSGSRNHRSPSFCPYLDERKFSHFHSRYGSFKGGER